ncbi:MAG: phosphomethylpyrimidine synthase ThiC, partial [Desulfobulbaceae bacterium]|nr:phosphomethylpyrimidine synthase ThiC [Desulfobulbaceae bacterium]
MKTQLEKARDGVVSEQMRQVATTEGLTSEIIRIRVAAGEIVIPCNSKRLTQKVVGIGRGLKTKV